MTRVEAHELLNAAKAGHHVGSQEITEALIATGDMAPCRRELSHLGDQGQFMPMEDRRLQSKYLEVFA